jgi:hypothetical protein
MFLYTHREATETGAVPARKPTAMAPQRLSLPTDQHNAPASRSMGLAVLQDQLLKRPSCAVQLFAERQSFARFTPCLTQQVPGGMRCPSLKTERQTTQP